MVTCCSTKYWNYNDAAPYKVVYLCFNWIQWWFDKYLYEVKYLWNNMVLEVSPNINVYLHLVYFLSLLNISCKVPSQFLFSSYSRLKYSISVIADKGLKKPLYTSSRLKKGEVLYLETHSRR